MYLNILNKELLIIKNYNELLSSVRHIDTLISSRIGTFFTASAFIFAGYIAIIKSTYTELSIMVFFLSIIPFIFLHFSNHFYYEYILPLQVSYRLYSHEILKIELKNKDIVSTQIIDIKSYKIFKDVNNYYYFNFARIVSLCWLIMIIISINKLKNNLIEFLNTYKNSSKIVFHIISNNVSLYLFILIIMVIVLSFFIVEFILNIRNIKCLKINCMKCNRYICFKKHLLNFIYCLYLILVSVYILINSDFLKIYNNNEIVNVVIYAYLWLVCYMIFRISHYIYRVHFSINLANFYYNKLYNLDVCNCNDILNTITDLNDVKYFKIENILRDSIGFKDGPFNTINILKSRTFIDFFYKIFLIIIISFIVILCYNLLFADYLKTQDISTYIVMIFIISFISSEFIIRITYTYIAKRNNENVIHTIKN